MFGSLAGPQVSIRFYQAMVHVLKFCNSSKIVFLFFLTVLWIREILVRIRGSVPPTYGSGFSPDTDPDSASFVSG